MRISEVRSRPRCRAALITFGQCETGMDFRRFISDAAEGLMPIALAKAEGPPKSEMI